MYTQSEIVRVMNEFVINISIFFVCLRYFHYFGFRVRILEEFLVKIDQFVDKNGFDEKTQVDEY